MVRSRYIIYIALSLLLLSLLLVILIERYFAQFRSFSIAVCMCANARFTPSANISICGFSSYIFGYVSCLRTFCKTFYTYLIFDRIVSHVWWSLHWSLGLNYVSHGFRLTLTRPETQSMTLTVCMCLFRNCTTFI